MSSPENVQRTLQMVKRPLLSRNVISEQQDAMYRDVAAVAGRLIGEHVWIPSRETGQRRIRLINNKEWAGSDASDLSANAPVIAAALTGRSRRDIIERVPSARQSLTGYFSQLIVKRDEERGTSIYYAIDDKLRAALKAERNLLYYALGAVTTGEHKLAWVNQLPLMKAATIGPDVDMNMHFEIIRTMEEYLPQQNTGGIPIGLQPIPVEFK